MHLICETKKLGSHPSKSLILSKSQSLLWFAMCWSLGCPLDGWYNWNKCETFVKGMNVFFRTYWAVLLTYKNILENLNYQNWFRTWPCFFSSNLIIFNNCNLVKRPIFIIFKQLAETKPLKDVLKFTPTAYRQVTFLCR